MNYTSRRTLLFFIISLLLVVAVGFSGTDQLPAGVTAMEHFSSAGDRADSGAFVRKGKLSLLNASIETYEADDFLHVSPMGWAEFTPPTDISSAEGTISIWIKPFWKEDDASHTLFSLTWNDGKNGYLALSQGWWEPEGAGRLYFILDNQEYTHCSIPYKFIPEFWTHVAVTWRSGSKGYCRIYLDGNKVAETHKSIFTAHAQKGPLIIGSDRGAAARRGRGVEGLFDDLAIFERSLNDKEIATLYRIQLKEPASALEKRNKWLCDGLKLPLKTERNKDGKLIETRAIFDEDILWATSRLQTDRILARIGRAGFNVYVPCVWHGKGTYFPSLYITSDPLVRNRIVSGDDPMAYLIAKAHSMGIEVHPWFTVVKRSSDEYPRYYDNGTPEGAYDVHNAEFRRFIVNLMVDMVRRYEVDGVNLDYIRAMGICTSESCRADYENYTGYQFWPDYALRGVHGAARDRLQAWQDAAVAQVVEVFAREARAARPATVVSVDGHPQPMGTTRPLEGRDEVKWVNNGLVDVIYSMDYRERVDVETIDLVRNELKDKRKLTVLFGNYERNENEVIARDADLVSKYAGYARRKWPGSGVAFYLYGRLSDAQIEALRKGEFAELSLPARRWNLGRNSN